MKIYSVQLAFQIFNFIVILTWMTGAIIIVYQFFREYRGKQYDEQGNVSEKFERWKTERYTRINKGIRIFTTGIVLQVLLLIVNYILQHYVK